MTACNRYQTAIKPTKIIISFMDYLISRDVHPNETGGLKPPACKSRTVKISTPLP